MNKQSFCDKCQDDKPHTVVSSGGVITPHRDILITILKCNVCGTKKNENHEEKKERTLLDG